ncbi:MAG: ATP-binding protein [Clostridia bacterium]
MELIKGKQRSAIKVCLYGVEGIGKSTFASKFPRAVFCDTEGSTKHMDVARTPTPLSWVSIIEQVKYFIARPDELGTFVLDTADWAERLCTNHILAKAQLNGIEDFGYGKGYTYLGEEFGRLLDLLGTLVDRGVNVVITAHAKMRKFEQPDEMGAYDRWEMKLSKACAPLVKEWADILLFATYKTYVINVDKQGAEKGKNKASGGARVMYTTHHPCWDAKNRFGLADEMSFDFAGIASLFQSTAPAPLRAPVEALPAQAINPAPAPPAPRASTPAPRTPPEHASPAAAAEPAKPAPTKAEDGMGEIPRALAELMLANKVAPHEIQYAVGHTRGYFPEDMPISAYPIDFINGCLVGGWDTVFDIILKNRDELPF